MPKAYKITPDTPLRAGFREKLIRVEYRMAYPEPGPRAPRKSRPKKLGSEWAGKKIKFSETTGKPLKPRAPRKKGVAPRKPRAQLVPFDQW